MKIYLSGNYLDFNEEKVFNAYSAIKEICNSCFYGNIEDCGDQIMQDCPVNMAKEAVQDLLLLLKARGANIK